MSSEFNYKQRAATPEYRENWDRVFGPKSCNTPPAAEPTPEAAEPLAGTEVSGVPASQSRLLESREFTPDEIARVSLTGYCSINLISSTCPWCHGAGCDLTPEAIAADEVAR